MLRLVRPLRSGGMSELWVAEHQGLHTQVVVKFLSPDLLRDEVSVARFQREAKAAAQVRSPHVVQYLEHGVCERGPYLVMELLEGEDLATRLKQGPMVLRDVAQVVVQIGRALSKAHLAGIVHRDIKPENIFLVDVGGNDIFCKLLDFGVAKGRRDPTTVTMNKTATGSLLGTPYYMSPEQAVNAKDIDFRTDIWAFGMVVFEALTGRRALEVDGLGALVLALHTTELPTLTSVNPTLPAALDAWFARACAREPTARFNSAREMAEAFLKAIDTPSRDALALQVTTPQPRQVILPAEMLSPPAAPVQNADPSQTPPAPVQSAGPSETPPKVPTLRPPAARRDVRPPEDDDSWKQLIDRSNAVRPTLVASPPPSPRSSALQPPLLPAPSPSRNPVLWLVVALAGLLLLVGVSLLVRGTGALHVLFPGTYPATSSPYKP
ncbi:MAG: protein kinase [Myxococcales bacterium]|nr:protein kinase [Polyangiaceae bacterium]MDW8251494.1 protein kinase [Myxococcales bacterium]